MLDLCADQQRSVVALNIVSFTMPYLEPVPYSYLWEFQQTQPETILRQCNQSTCTELLVLCSSKVRLLIVFSKILPHFYAICHFSKLKIENLGEFLEYDRF